MAMATQLGHNSDKDAQILTKSDINETLKSDSDTEPWNTVQSSATKKNNRDTKPKDQHLHNHTWADTSMNSTTIETLIGTVVDFNDKQGGNLKNKANMDTESPTCQDKVGNDHRFKENSEGQNKRHASTPDDLRVNKKNT